MLARVYLRIVCGLEYIIRTAYWPEYIDYRAVCWPGRVHIIRPACCWPEYM